MTLYKALDGLTPINGGFGDYPPVGEWTEHLDLERLRPCVYGYHLVAGGQLIRWIGPNIYEAEACPEHDPVDDDGKVVTCAVRLTRHTEWDERAARRFAADCAEAALLGERACGREPDRRSWQAVAVARRDAEGEATYDERAAARSAAWSAWAAARDDAWAAAGCAAWAAARSAWAAAWSAAWSAWAAARDDAWAAGDAARQLLTARLMDYLHGRDPGPVTPLYGTTALDGEGDDE